ncbi:MAG: nucleoside recognition protein [Tissierellia bacterium]|nr:nucleoside recognition protein [Tissierellia bacterium]
MLLYKESAINGFKKGVTTLWNLSKIVVPVYFLVIFLSYTGILNIISDLCEPVMNIFGLPGEASLPLVLGNFINLYAGLGAMASMTLTSKQVTILAIMLSFSHSLFLESAVVKKVGVSVGLAVLIRIVLALILGIIFNLIL